MNIEIIENRRLWETDQSVQITDKGITIQVEGVSETFDFTGFTEDGDYVLEDCLTLPYNPVQSIKKDGDGFVVSVFYDNPFEYVEDWTPPFERKGQVIKLVPTADGDLEMAKARQYEIIQSGFTKEFEAGHFPSSVLGIEVDCRRSGVRNDLQNVDGLILDYPNLSEMEKYYVGYTEVTAFPLSLEQLNGLKIEMVQWGRGQYAKKWTLENMIKTAVTIEEVKGIVW